MNVNRTALWTSAALLGLALIVCAPASADFVINDDLIVDGSACVGFDCVNGESFGFDTIRLKENNLRIDFTDTSSAASFPDRDWRIGVNDTTNGGAEKFFVEDRTAGRQPFIIEGGAPANALYVDDGGRLGLGTNAPVVDVHIKSGNTPTLRLEQDTSSGFAAQTWDVAGNEANFFIRDVTNGSTLPLRIFPDAPSNALTIEATGDIGLGTTSPDDELHIVSSESTADFRLESTNGGGTEWRLRANASTDQLVFQDAVTTNSVFKISGGSGNNALVIDADGLDVASACIELGSFACTASAGAFTCVAGAC